MEAHKKKAIELSLLGEHKLHRVGAVIAKRKRQLAHGWNRSKTHPKSTHPWRYLHAEMDAILRCNESLQGAEIFVARLGKVGDLRAARPCPACMDMIKQAGIVRVHYTDDGNWHTFELDN
jgi:deoxycytidylate deaminase